MWKRLRPYVTFCRLAFDERFKPLRGYKPVRWLFVVIAFIAGTVLGDTFDIPYIDLVKPVFKLLGYQWVIIIVFGGVIINLLFLIDGARRYHERIVSELRTDHESEMKRREKHLNNIRELMGAYGECVLAYNITDHNELLSKDSIQRVKDTVAHTLYQVFQDSKKVDEYYERNASVADSIPAQKAWTNGQCFMLREYIKQ